MVLIPSAFVEVFFEPLTNWLKSFFTKLLWGVLYVLAVLFVVVAWTTLFVLLQELIAYLGG